MKDKKSLSETIFERTKSWKSENVLRSTLAEQSGRLTNWALQTGFDYAAEVHSLSAEKVSDFVRNLATILKNEDELEWNSIDTYVWKDDGLYGYKQVDESKETGKTNPIICLIYIMHINPPVPDVSNLRTSVF